MQSHGQGNGVERSFPAHGCENLVCIPPFLFLVLMVCKQPLHHFPANTPHMGSCWIEAGALSRWPGYSFILDPNGEIIAESVRDHNVERMLTAELDPTLLSRWRVGGRDYIHCRRPKVCTPLVKQFIVNRLYCDKNIFMLVKHKSDLPILQSSFVKVCDL